MARPHTPTTVLTPLVTLPPGDLRRRQSKRDEQIRRKIGADMSKQKRPATSRSVPRGVPGLVLLLRPLAAVTCKPSATALEAARVMGAARENCILVESGDGQLVGIVTAKDLAFRVVGQGLAASRTTVEAVMTAAPQCCKASEPALEALALMVQRGFRHLPVVLDDGVVGVLDITRCYAEAMAKLDRMYQLSQQLHAALSLVLELGLGEHPPAVADYFEELKTRMASPTLQLVLDPRARPVFVLLRLLVDECARLMREHRTTAVLVANDDGTTAGIFTSKDVVLRVVAAGLDPKTVLVVRVMTPRPDTAVRTTPIQTALRQMLDGRYLNLPVVDEAGEVVGVAEVLTLTTATLSQLQQLLEPQTPQGARSPTSGPAWNRFWTGDGDLASDLDSLHAMDSMHALDSELKPDDLVLVAGGGPLVAALALDTPFAFKFRLPSGRVHRFTACAADGWALVRATITDKLTAEDFAVLLRRGPPVEDLEASYTVLYTDDDGDAVVLTNDHDLAHCVSVWRDHPKAELTIHHPCGWERREWVAGVPNEAVMGGVAVAIGVVALAAMWLRRR